MALRAFVRSRVMTARPLPWTVPLTNSSEAAITANLRNDTNGVDLEDNFIVYEWELKKKVERQVEIDDDLDKLIRGEAVNKLGMIDLEILTHHWRSTEKDELNSISILNEKEF